jgi:hypothetical protein
MELFIHNLTEYASRSIRIEFVEFVISHDQVVVF